MDRLAAMETFTRVVETGSFSSAARCLNVGQPAVSKSVALLESWLGVRLLLRSTRGLKPTEAGRDFYERARRVIEQADEADHVARGSKTELSGLLRVCATSMFAQLHIFPKLKAFVEQYPLITIDLILNDQDIDLQEEGIDVAMCMGDLEDSAMTASKIGQSRRIVVGSQAYIDSHGEPKDPSDLLNHQAIGYGHGGSDRIWSFQRDGTDVSVVVAGRIRVTAVEGVRAAVLANIGVAVSPEWIFAPELASGEVKIMLSEWSLPSVDLWAVYPSGRLASAKARAFVNFVKITMVDHVHVPQNSMLNVA